MSTRKVCVYVLSCLVMSDYPMDYRPPGSSAHGISQARILDWVHFLLKGIFPRQRLNLCLLHWQTDSYH